LIYNRMQRYFEERQHCSKSIVQKGTTTMLVNYKRKGEVQNNNFYYCNSELNLKKTVYKNLILINSISYLIKNHIYILITLLDSK